MKTRTRRWAGLSLAALCVGLSPSIATAADDASSKGGGSGSSAKGSDSASSGSSQPFTGKVTLDPGAGQSEGAVLAASAIRAAARHACEAIVERLPDRPPGPSQVRILVVPGQDAPDISAWLLLDARLTQLDSQLDTALADITQRQLEYAQVRRSIVSRTPRTSGGARASGADIITAVVRMLTPPAAAIAAAGRIAQLAGAVAQSNYEAGGITLTTVDYQFGADLAGRLAGGHQVSLVNHLSQRKAASSLQTRLSNLEQKVAILQRAVLPLPDLVKTLKSDEAHADATSKAHIKSLEDALVAAQANASVLVANLATMEAALTALPPATSTSTTSTPAKSDATDAGDPAQKGSSTPKDTGSTKGSSSAGSDQTSATPTPTNTQLLPILAQKTIADFESQGDVYLLYVKIQSAGGGLYSKQNLLTFFGGMPFYVSGSATTVYSLVNANDVEIAAGQLPWGGKYLKATEVEGALAADRRAELTGACKGG